MDRSVPPPSRRRLGTSVRTAGALAAAALAATPMLTGLLGSHGAAYACGPGEQLFGTTTGPTSCAHSDEAPPGVDVTEPVSTAELRTRDGAGLEAYRAAQDLGVPMSTSANASTPAVSCDGDGTSGDRVQAMYVVEAGRPNRFASLLPSFKLWAAGADDVVNRSAALTGGVRNVRYVTEAGAVADTCEAKVLNLTVPSGSLATFGSAITAVQQLGFSDPSRKYLMWTDATVLCGVANLYPYDNPAQSNPNNGSYPQYARVDSGCWGFGDGAWSHSVEAHELVHTLGAVNRSAAHSTVNGHCWDENDTMCYADGDSHPMVQVCPAQREYLLDCNSDDYFSTLPPSGSYLADHWNAADSRFLVGGGDGTGGGSAGSPTSLGATIAVNNPAVPGLVTQVEVTPVLPKDRTVATVAWTSARKDCVFDTPAETQSTVSCPASASGKTTVTVRLTDSSGETKTLTSPLTFATRTSRAVRLSTAVDGQDGTPASVCTGAGFPVAVSVTDVATGLPVRGLPVTVTRKTATQATASGAGAGTTSISGVGVVTGRVTATTEYAARTNAGTVFAAGTSTPVSAVPAKCAVQLDGSGTPDTVYTGDPVTLGGTLTRQVGGETVGVVGALLPVRHTWVDKGVTRSAVLATAKTAADGSWSIGVKPTRSGRLATALPASAGWDAASLDLGAVTVLVPTTDLTASVDHDDVGTGSPVAVTGALRRTAGELTTPVAAATVTLRLTPTGSTRSTTLGSARTKADGTYAVTVPLRASGTLTVSYAGSAVQPVASVDLGAVTAGTWDTAVSLSATRGATGVTVGGTVSRTYAASTSGAPAVAVRVFFTPTSTGTTTQVARLTTRVDGTYAGRVSTKVAGTWTAKVVSVVGYADASSAGVDVTGG